MQLNRYFEVSQAPDVDAFRSRLVSWAHDMEFAFVVAALVHEDVAGSDRPVFVALGNTPQEYEASSAVALEDSLRDPVLRRLKQMSVPVIYDQTTYTSEGAGDLWETQAAFGFRTGVAVALHLPGNKHFLLGVDREEPLPDDEPRLVRLMADLQLLAVHAQEAAVRLLRPPAPEVEVPRLGQRELEILRWTMAGKSAWAVGQLLSISENTVNFHFRNIFRKLGTSSKHQSVLKAMHLGLLQ